MKTKSITDINNQVIDILGNISRSVDWDKFYKLSGTEQRELSEKRRQRIDRINSIKQTYYSNIICSEEYKKQHDAIECKSGVNNLPWDCSQRTYLERCNRNEFNRIQIPIDTYRGVSKSK